MCAWLFVKLMAGCATRVASTEIMFRERKMGRGEEGDEGGGKKYIPFVAITNFSRILAKLLAIWRGSTMSTSPPVASAIFPRFSSEHSCEII